MTGEIEHGVMAARFIAIGVGDQGAGIVGHDQRRHTAVKRQGACRRFEPVGHGFAVGGPGEGEAGRTHGRDEDMNASAIGQGDSRTGEVDE
jgi:hypothetical protein